MSGLYGQEHVPVGEELILLPPHAAPLCVTGAEPSALTLEEIQPRSVLCS